jgi:membrane protein YqaA with SNARE-associated domain
MPALAAVSFAESSFFPVPPDVLLIALAAGRPRRAFLYAAVCTAASVAGGLFGYTLGAAFMETVGNAILRAYHLQEEFLWVQAKYREAAFWAVFTAALTPIPYKVFTLAAGAAQVSIPAFLLASVLGRGGRFFGVAALLYAFGPIVRAWIERYFDRLAILFLLLLLGGFFVLRWLLR